MFNRINPNFFIKFKIPSFSKWQHHLPVYIPVLKMEENGVAVDLSSKRLEPKEHFAKKFKPSTCGDTENTDESCNNIHTQLASFRSFQIRKVLNENAQSKSIFVEGTFGSDERTAVLLLEKLPFSKETVDKILTDETRLTQKFHNDIYGNYEGYPKAELNGIKATIIHPATEKHVQKYQYQPIYLVNESPELYKTVILPYLESQQFSLQWVYNILEHKSEVERIVFEDPNPETGFILLPDMKWDETQLDSLYVLAICHQKGLKSLRDLSSNHLPLLRNVKEKGLETIFKKYQKPASKIRVYLHYQPSYYHLHIHFTAIETEAPGIQVERYHLLDTVITNLELVPDYYQKATLTYTVKENDPLYTKLHESGRITA